MNQEKMDLHFHECIRLCWECRDICQDTLYNHILERNAQYLDANAIRTLTDCMEICRMAADFMRRNSPLHHITCNACAAICEACADCCERLAKDYPAAKKCAESCRLCADSCHRMSRMQHAA